MSRFTLVGAELFTGDAVLPESAVLVEDGMVAAVLPASAPPPDAETVRLDGGLLAPGLVDVQVNGGGGVLFNDDPSVDTVRRIAAAHRRFGTTALLPTLISDRREAVARAVAAVAGAIEQGVPGVVGIHLEGPFLSHDRRGCHPADRLATAERADVELLASLPNGATVVTLAPEAVPDGFVAALCAAGLRVCAGHTDATYDEVRRALDAGLSGFTHLFNAMSRLQARAPGAVGAALEDPQSWCGVIVDGHHVHPATLRVALAAKPRGKVMLVSDAMATVGSDADRFSLFGEPVTVREGRCLNADGVLAGSALDMAAAVRNAIDMLGVAREEALRMASLYPAAFAGLDARHGRIAPGCRADFVWFDAALRVRATWIGGIREDAP